MGDRKKTVSVLYLLKWRLIERFGDAAGQLDKLTPNHDETIDTILARVSLPLAAPTQASNPE